LSSSEQVSRRLLGFIVIMLWVVRFSILTFLTLESRMNTGFARKSRGNVILLIKNILYNNTHVLNFSCATPARRLVLVELYLKNAITF